MSFDIFLQRFQSELPGGTDPAAIMAVLEPFIRDRGDDWARLQTADGGADVHGLGGAGDSVMINHTSGGAVWNLIFELASAGAYVVMPAGCGTFVTNPEVVQDLPLGLPEPVVIIASGGELRRLVEKS